MLFPSINQFANIVWYRLNENCSLSVVQFRTVVISNGCDIKILIIISLNNIENKPSHVIKTETKITITFPWTNCINDYAYIWWLELQNNNSKIKMINQDKLTIFFIIIKTLWQSLLDKDMLLIIMHHSLKTFNQFVNKHRPLLLLTCL